MARPKNPDNVYELTCKVTGITRKTNPKQFADLMVRYDLTKDELVASYVSSGINGGRRIIAEQHLTPQQAVEKYGINIKLAEKLVATRQKVVAVKKTTLVENVNSPEPVNTEPVNTTDTIVEKTSSGYSVSIPVEDEVEASA
jgi:hypothetical protein